MTSGHRSAMGWVTQPLRFKEGFWSSSTWTEPRMDEIYLEEGAA